MDTAVPDAFQIKIPYVLKSHGCKTEGIAIDPIENFIKALSNKLLGFVFFFKRIIGFLITRPFAGDVGFGFVRTRFSFFTATAGNISF